MKTKKKAKPLRPRKKVRRDPIGRALEVTEKKYETAVAQFRKCIATLVVLKDEIPKLAERIRVLGGAPPDMPETLAAAPARGRHAVMVEEPGDDTGPDETERAQARVILQHPLSERIPTGPPPADIMAAIPPAVRHMIKEHPAAMKESFGAMGGVEDVKLD